MAKLLKLRRGSTSAHASFTGAEGEVTIDTTKDTAVVHDGSQAGGRPLAREDMSNVSSASIAGQLGTDSIATTKIAGGALPTDVTVASANIVDGTIINADVNASAAIAGTKVSPNFGSQSIITTGGCDTGNLTVTGQIVARKSQEPQIVLQDSDSGNTGSAAETSIAFRDGGGNLQAQIGHHSSSDSDLYFDTSNTGNRMNFRVGGTNPPQLEIRGGECNFDSNIILQAGHTVDGRDVAADGSKLDGIESGATGDQTAAEIRTLVESASDSNVFTDADHSKLNGIESGATADQTASEILTLVKTVDGSSSGLDADTVDGKHAGDFMQQGAPNSSNHYNMDNWIESNGNQGLYYPNNYNYHVYLDGQYLRIRNDQNANGIAIYTNGSSRRGYVYADNSNSIGFLNGSGSWSLKCDSSGNVTATGNVTAYSDARLKTDIHTINDALSICGKLRGVSYKWIADGKPSIGVIAQEVEEVLPEVVLTQQVLDPTGEREVKSVDYGKIVGVLINAINELKAEVDELKGGK